MRNLSQKEFLHHSVLTCVYIFFSLYNYYVAELERFVDFKRPIDTISWKSKNFHRYNVNKYHYNKRKIYIMWFDLCVLFSSCFKWNPFVLHVNQLLAVVPTRPSHLTNEVLQCFQTHRWIQILSFVQAVVDI